MKKIAVIMAVLMMILSLASCGGKKPDASAAPDASKAPDASTAPAPTEEGPKDPLEGLEKKDLNGYEFSIRTFRDIFFVPDEVSGPVSEAKLDRNKAVEDFYNCKIVYQEASEHNHWNEASPSILGGEKWGDIIAPTMWMMSFFTVNNALADLSKISTIKLDAPYYNQNAVRAGTMNGITYMLSGDILPANEYTSAIAFNKSLIEEFQMEDPYQLVRDGKWNIDTYREMARAATRDNGDGVMDRNDIWGHTGTYDDYDIASFCATGLPLVGEKDGEMQLLINTPEAMKASQKLKDLMNTDGTRYVRSPSGDWAEVYDVYKEGHILFIGHRVEAFFSLLRDMEQDWGLLPWPKVADGQENYSGWVDHNVPMIGIPVSNADAETSGLILDAMGRVSHDMLLGAQKEEWSSLHFRDEESLEMLDLVTESAYYDPTFFLRHGIGDINNVVSIMLESISENGDFASSCEQYQATIQDALDNFFGQGVYAE